MKVEIFENIPHEAIEIRKKVFMEEQGFVSEFDEIDPKAVHFVLYDDGCAIGTCRIYEDSQDKIYILGRLAVTKESRGKNAGSLIVRSAEEYVKGLGGKELRLHAQCRISEFYSKLGFCAFGDMDYDEDCPHIWMRKRL